MRTRKLYPFEIIECARESVVRIFAARIVRTNGRKRAGNLEFLNADDVRATLRADVPYLRGPKLPEGSLGPKIYPR